MIDRQDFQDLVKEDASEIKGRQETDSIGIIDDIRFHLTNFVQTYSEMEEANERLRLVDDLLEDLNLDGWIARKPHRTESSTIDYLFFFMILWNHHGS